MLELGLKMWMDVDRPPIESLNWSDEVQHLLEHQQELGWKHLSWGQFLTKWMELQQCHLQEKFYSTTN
eukprot:13471975-Ditylum_brightwellii.AAC.1